MHIPMVVVVDGVMGVTTESVPGIHGLEARGEADLPFHRFNGIRDTGLVLTFG